MLKVLFTGVPVWIVFLLAGCSNQQIYEILRARDLNRCDTAPLSQQKECRLRSSQNYEDYKQALNTSGERTKQVEPAPAHDKSP